MEELFLFPIPLIAVGALLAAIGQGVGLMVGPCKTGWRGWWHRTRALHPIAVGILLGYTSLPVPESMGPGLTGRMVWYGMAGGLAVPLYEMVRRTIEKRNS